MSTLKCVCFSLIIIMSLPKLTLAEWKNAFYGVEMNIIPKGWSVKSSTPKQLQLVRRYETYSLWYDEKLTVSVSRASARTIKELEFFDKGFLPVDSGRISPLLQDIPFWVYFNSRGPSSIAWLAVLLHNGLAYSVEIDAAIDDDLAMPAFYEVVKALHILPDQHDQAWQAMAENDLQRSKNLFTNLLKDEPNDANARYGLGLVQLAEGSISEAIKNLKWAQPILGIEEDVRRALGGAYLAQGDHIRAIVTWIECLRDDPSWEAELRPLILNALDEEAALNRPDKYQEQQLHLIALGTDFLLLAQKIEQCHLEGTSLYVSSEIWRPRIEAYRSEYTYLLAETVKNKAKADLLLPLWDLEQALVLFYTGLQEQDSNLYGPGTLQIIDVMRNLKLYTME